MGQVTITEANGGLGGTLQTGDGIVGFVMTGRIDTGGYVLGTPKLVTGLASATAAGITTDGNAAAVRQLQQFYAQAGDGAQLYLMLVVDTLTIDDIADITNEDGAKKLLDYAGGKIKVLGIMTDDTSVTATVTDALNSDIPAAVVNMEIMTAAYKNAQKPFRGIIGGTSYSGVAGDLLPVNAGTTNNRTAILIGDTDSATDTMAGKGACMGLLLGTVASIPVQRKVSRVRTGALPISKAYVGSIAVDATGADTAVIASAGYITFTTYPNVGGYFFSGDPMCAAPTDDYCMLARGRVIDKAHILAYATFVQEIDDEIPINTDGTLDAGFCKWLEQQIVNQVNNAMTANKEISSIRCFIDPAQNILSTNQLNVVLRITPVGYATDIEISLGFENPANG